jgi:uncharacterized protein (TIGR02611 family)
VWTRTYRSAQRLVVLVVGLTIAAAGVVMLVTPGPGLLAIFAGLSLLATEFAWAKWFLERVKQRGKKIVDSVRGRDDTLSRDQGLG